MLRHIVSICLTMAACVALIPTKANAATLTVQPEGGLEKKAGDSIVFKFMFDPELSNTLAKKVVLLNLGYDYDGGELSLIRASEKWLVEPNEEGEIVVNNTESIVHLKFDIPRTPIKGGGDDLFDAFITYKEFDRDNNVIFEGNTKSVVGGDVVPPVPEPLTIFGTFTGLGCGILFKRKSSKKKKS